MIRPRFFTGAIAACLCLVAMPLGGCAAGVSTPTSPGAVATAVDRADTTIAGVTARYQAAKAIVDPWVDLLPPARAAQVRAAGAAVEQALALARMATSAASRLAALKRARAEIDHLTAAGSAPASS
jgi:hypothetical protein